MKRRLALLAAAILVSATPALAAAPAPAPAAKATTLRAKRDPGRCVTARLPLDARHRTCHGRAGRWW